MRAFKLLALLSACTLAGGAVGYFAAVKNERVNQLDTFYSFSAASARTTTTALTLLRSGGTDKAMPFLEAALTTDLISLGSYERDVPQRQRQKEVYEGVAKAREYYAKFPDAAPSPYAADGLALGTTAPHNAP